MLKTNNSHSTFFEKEKKVKLLFYNKFYNFDYPRNLASHFPDVEFLFEKERIEDADVVVFHIPSLELISLELKRLKNKTGQKWVFWSYECEKHFPEFEEQEIKSLFELTATYKLDADISLNCLSNHADANWRATPQQKSAFINAFCTSRWDKNGRYKYLETLMSYLDIHSFGQIFNNRPRENDPYLKIGLNKDSFEYKEEIISKYKFTIAFENATAKDYVTEKFFQPLILGSVPIYLGAPNVEDFAPGDNCYINVNSFASAKELADYLILLDSNDDLYNEYLKWKNLPFRNGFESKLKASNNMLGQLIPLISKR